MARIKSCCVPSRDLDVDRGTVSGGAIFFSERGG